MTVDDLSSKGIATAVARAVREGTLPEGHKMPPIRDLATDLGVSPTTVAAAWQLLTRSGVLVTSGRRGTSVARHTGPTLRYRRAVDASSNVRLDLSTGVPDPRLLPDLGSAVGALTDAVAPGSYLDPPVLPALESHIATSWPFSVSTLAVVDGAMDALDLAGRVLFGFGDRVIVETPCFPPLLDLLDSHGVEVVAVGLDQDGLDPEGLRAAMERPVRAIVLQPRAQNPTGISMSPERAEAIARLLEGKDTIVLEDESWSAVAQADPVSIGRWLPEQTIHVRSYSKSHGPDLRIAALSAPAEIMKSIGALRQHGQGWTSRILQRILYELLTDPTSAATIDHARAVYAQRREQMVSALSDHGVTVSGSDGFNIWVPVADETSTALALANQGIGVASGSPFQTDPTAPPHVRVTVSSLDDGFDAVARALASASRGQNRPMV